MGLSVFCFYTRENKIVVIRTKTDSKRFINDFFWFFFFFGNDDWSRQYYTTQQKVYTYRIYNNDQIAIDVKRTTENMTMDCKRDEKKIDVNAECEIEKKNEGKKA